MGRLENRKRVFGRDCTGAIVGVRDTDAKDSLTQTWSHRGRSAISWRILARCHDEAGTAPTQALFPQTFALSLGQIVAGTLLDVSMKICGGLDPATRVEEGGLRNHQASNP